MKGSPKVPVPGCQNPISYPAMHLLVDISICLYTAFRCSRASDFFFYAPSLALNAVHKFYSKSLGINHAKSLSF